DPLAVKAARKNIYVNKVARRVSCREADIENFRPVKRYALVAANLFANLLVRSAGRLADLIEPGQYSRLLVSGILKRQYASVKRVFAACGLREEKRKPMGEWVTAMYKRKEEGAQ
ncbi:MAG: 50S ribosomal protein L11 methyltransferase, partial [Kiritimatiellia bacterium]